MGRKKRNCIYEYYQYDEFTKTSKCLMSDCNAILKGKHGANLMRHFQFRHKKEFYQIHNNNKERAREISLNTNPGVKDRLLKNLMDLITVHGRPVTLLDDDAFKVLLNMIPISKTCLNEVKELVKQKARECNRNPDAPTAASPSPSVAENQRADTPDVDDDMSAINETIDDQPEIIDLEQEEPRRVKVKKDPLDEQASDGHSSPESSESEEEYEVPIQTELLTQGSRVRERRRSDVVRKNNAIAGYYEAKKMKVHLEIKKLQLEMDVRKRRQIKNSDNIIEIEVKKEIESWE